MPGQQTKKGRDGLPVLVQGAWSRDKLYFVEYFEALFNGGMKNLWPTRAYVDLFSGPGMCIDRDTGEEFEGSPLLALGCSTPFTHHYFNDIDTELIGALEQRQQRLFPQAATSIDRAKVTYSTAAERGANTRVYRPLGLRGHLRRSRFFASRAAHRRDCNFSLHSHQEERAPGGRRC